MSNSHMIVLVIKTDDLKLVQVYSEFASTLAKAAQTTDFAERVSHIKKAESKKKQVEQRLKDMNQTGSVFIKSYRDSLVDNVYDPVLKNRLKNGLFTREELQQASLKAEEMQIEELFETFKGILQDMQPEEQIIFWNMEESAANALLSN